MDPPHLLQGTRAHTSRSDGLSRSEQHSWIPVFGSAKPYAEPSRTSSLQSYYTLPYSSTPPYVPSPLNASTPPNASTLPSAPTLPNAWPSNASLQSYYSANTSPLSYLSSSTRSSIMSFPFSVTSINSYKSRKNVLYPRRVHPLPVAVASEHSVSPDVRFLSGFPLSLLLNTHTLTSHRP